MVKFCKMSFVLSLQPTIFLVLILTTSCQKEPDSPTTVYQVPPSVEPYVQRFLLEAQKRGKNFQIDNLIVKLSDQPIEPTPGQYSCGITTGKITKQHQNIIRIDTQCLAWRYNDTSREVLIFHELGHAILLRFHDNSRLPNGAWKTLMTGTRWSIFDFYITEPSRRDYYIDELFNPNTPTPDWGQ